jgi:hypothetical protein
MGKFIYAVMLVYVIELALWLFGGTTYSNSSLFTLLLDPSAITSSAFYTVIIVAMGGFALATIIPGNLWQINVYALYAGIGVIVITFVISIAHLWMFIGGELEGILTAQFTTLIQILITSPILVTYLLAVAEWVRSNS